MDESGILFDWLLSYVAEPGLESCIKRDPGVCIIGSQKTEIGYGKVIFLIEIARSLDHAKVEPPDL